jgi:hypothetical protein
MTGHAFQTLLTDDDVLAALDTMRLHLREGGRVAFETRNPRVDWAAEWTARPPRVHNLPSGEIVERLQVTGAEGEFISFQTSYRSSQMGLTTNSTLRFLSREQVEALLARSALEICEVFGDWQAAPFEAAHSREIIFIVKIAG